MDAMPRRFVLTGAPGCGKTALLHVLRDRGYDVVEEAATDVIAAAQAHGNAQPWTRPAFVAEVLDLQRRREAEAPRSGGVQFFDRSPVCTLALARYLGYAVPPALQAELDRIVRERIYQRRAFLLGDLGFVEATAARRVTLEQAREFERLHVECYRQAGFDLVEVPADSVEARADFVEAVTAFT